jgi:Flp pilus assembly pilin Flp
MLLELYVKMMNMLRHEEGQDLAEYAILIALIALGVIAAVLVLRDDIAGVFQDIGTTLGEQVPG